MRKLASIIIVNYNGEDYLQACLDSVLRQDYASYEVIVVDNNSADRSGQVLEQYSGRVKVVYLDQNTGFGGGCLEGLRRANGEYVVLFNNDTVPAEDCLEKLLAPFEDDPKIGSCAAKMLVEGTDIIDTAGDGCTTTGRGIKIGEGKPSFEYNSSRYVFGACAGAAAYRRQMIDQIGFLDADFFLVREDTDLSFRAQLAGWKCYFVHDAVVEHKVSASLGRLNDRAVYYAVRNTSFVRLKNMPVALMVKYFHHLIFEEAAGFFYFAIKHRLLRAYLKAKLDGLKYLPLMLKKRAAVRKLKRISNREIEGLLTGLFEGDFFRAKGKKLLGGKSDD